MRLTRVLASSFLLSAVLVLVASAGQKKFEKSFDVSSGGYLRVTTDVGDVKVTGGTGSRVTVVATIEGSERDRNDFEVTAKETSEGIEVVGELDKAFHWGSNDLEVVFEITVPKSYNIRIGAAGGSVSVKGIQGKVRTETSGGDIKGVDLTGSIAFSTSGGDIYADGITGDTELETSGGDIAVKNVKGSVASSTSGGDVMLSDVEGRIVAQTSGGDVRISSTSSSHDIAAETSGGDIEIAVPRSIAADVDASTFGGSVMCDLPITLSGKIDESSVHGKINGGGASLRAHTMGGDIRIRARD